MWSETIPPRVDLSRKRRDPHAKVRDGDQEANDERTLGSDASTDDVDAIPEGFHRPNVGPVTDDEHSHLRAAAHPNDPAHDAEPEATNASDLELAEADPLEPFVAPADADEGPEEADLEIPEAADPLLAGPATSGSTEESAPLTFEEDTSLSTRVDLDTFESADPTPGEAPPSGSDDEADDAKGRKRSKKAKKAKKEKKPKKSKKGKGSPADGGLEAPEGAPEDDTEGAATEGSAQEIVSGHRFGLRLGSHQAGNLLTKLKSRFSKDVETATDAIQHEEEEAISERIEPDDRYKEIETYPIHPPYAYVRILFDDERKDYIYQVLEPLLTKTEKEILDFIEHTIIDNLTVSPEQLEGADELEFITEQFNDVIFDYSIILHEDETEEDAIKKKLLYYLRRDFIGHGPVDIQMNDPYIEDISCDGPHVPIFLYHRKYENMRSTTIFGEHDKLDGYVIKMAQRSGKHISIAEPILDATMTDGSRLQATLGTEVSAGGSTFTIRKFRPDPFTPPDLVLFRTMSAEMLSYLWISVQNGASIMYAGGTASGKTTSLNAILLFIPPNMKIVSIEDTREVNLPHENWIAGITRNGFGPRDQFGRQAGEIDMFQLLKNALRQRPEYIIVGEVRGAEAYSLFQAMATGHAAYGTMHADSVDAVIHRLESDPINIPRSLLEALDIVSVQIQTRVGGKRVRRTKQISEIVGLDPHTREILTNEVFRWLPKDDSFKFSGVSYILERIQLEKGMPPGSMVKELTRRAEIIQWMIKMHIQDYQDVSRVVSAYYKEPEVVLGIVRGDIAPDEAPVGLRQLAMRGGHQDDDPLSATALAAVAGTDSEGSPGSAPAPNPTAASHPTVQTGGPAPEGLPEAVPEEAPAEDAAIAESDLEVSSSLDEAQHQEPEAPAVQERSSSEGKSRAPISLDQDPPAGWTGTEDLDEEDPRTEEPGDEPSGGWGDASAGMPLEEDATEEHESGPAHAATARQASPVEGEDWLRKVEEKIRARYDELEREKKRRLEEGEETKETTGGEGH